ncbi:hypothetical protein HDU86_004334 [Geranomyces michiganensis]|nr:hypothetical protein HDU86_004334 [Geranomyces michiganensis]
MNRIDSFFSFGVPQALSLLQHRTRIVLCAHHAERLQFARLRPIFSHDLTCRFVGNWQQPILAARSTTVAFSRLVSNTSANPATPTSSPAGSAPAPEAKHSEAKYADLVPASDEDLENGNFEFHPDDEYWVHMKYLVTDCNSVTEIIKKLRHTADEFEQKQEGWSLQGDGIYIGLIKDNARTIKRRQLGP